MSEKYTPHFDEATIGQELTNVEGSSSFSLWKAPSTSEHSVGMHQRTGRQEFLDIDSIRAEAAVYGDIARLDQEYEQKHVFKNVYGTKVGTRIVNAEATGGTIGLMTSWSTDAEWENTKGIVEALALTFPDKRIMYIETPGMGDSDKLLPDRKRKLTNTGSFEPMALQIAAALQTEKIEFEALVGVSEGSRAVISLAEKMGTKTVVTLDPPGTKEQYIGTFGKHFMLDEQSAQKQVLKNSPDLAMVDAHKNIDSKILAKQGYAATQRQLLARAKAMAKAGLSTDIQSVCQKDVEIFDYRCASSTFASSETMVELAKVTPGYNAITLPDAPHGINEGNPFAISQLVVQAFELQKHQSKSDKAVEAAKRILS